jgi:hypothetical protein
MPPYVGRCLELPQDVERIQIALLLWIKCGEFVPILSTGKAGSDKCNRPNIRREA